MAATRGARTRTRSKPVTFEQIESEAVKLFSERTYPVVGMRDISDTVGILPGSLYAHIANKEELLLGIVRHGIHNYIDALGPISESDDSAADRLRLIMRKYMEILDGTLEQTRVSFNQWTYLSPENQQEVVELRHTYEQIFSRVITDGIAADEFTSVRHPRVAVLATMGLLNSAMRWYTRDGSLGASEIGDDLADLMLQGLCSAGAGTN
ncbi:MAG TPA: TetR/AcrR family transcriptional regulator [Pseudonocardia sp.]|nr:TetR/AcrR family transcriptional regulator [Pseudonocardia sp.]